MIVVIIYFDDFQGLNFPYGHSDQKNYEKWLLMMVVLLSQYPYTQFWLLHNN